MGAINAVSASPAVDDGKVFVNPISSDERPNQTLFMPYHHAVSDVLIAFENVHQADDTALREGELLRQAPASTTLIEP